MEARLRLTAVTGDADMTFTLTTPATAVSEDEQTAPTIFVEGYAVPTNKYTKKLGIHSPWNEVAVSELIQDQSYKNSIRHQWHLVSLSYGEAGGRIII